MLGLFYIFRFAKNTNTLMENDRLMIKKGENKMDFRLCY